MTKQKIKIGERCLFWESSAWLRYNSDILQIYILTTINDGNQ